MKHWYQTHKDTSSITQLFADKVSSFCGSWLFFLLHIVWFAIWIVFHVEPYPYGLLTMIVSLEAILLSTIVMISQNRAGDRDRSQAQHDYRVNEDAKQEIEDLQVSIARIETIHFKELKESVEKLLAKKK